VEKIKGYLEHFPSAFAALGRVAEGLCSPRVSGWVRLSFDLPALSTTPFFVFFPSVKITEAEWEGLSGLNKSLPSRKSCNSRILNQDGCQA
jgi:hypothetical protein